MSRRQARVNAFSLIFQLPFHDETDIPKILENYIDEHKGPHDTYISAAFNGVTQNLEQIDRLISDNLLDWDIDRIATSDLAALRLCVYELLFDPAIPEAVSVNEAVELVKIYGTDDSYAFVNGVLAGVLKTIHSAS